MKLLENNDKLMEESNEYRVQHEKLGAWMSEGQAQFAKERDGSQSGQSEFQVYEDSVNFPPGVTQPSWPSTDLQRSKPTPPSTPPPMYLVRRFKSKTKANTTSWCSKKKGLGKKDGLGKAHPIGQAIGNWHGTSKGRMALAMAHPIGQAIGNLHGTGQDRMAWAKAPPVDPPGQGSFCC